MSHGVDKSQFISDAKMSAAVLLATKNAARESYEIFHRMSELRLRPSGGRSVNKGQMEIALGMLKEKWSLYETSVNN